MSSDIVRLTNNNGPQPLKTTLSASTGVSDLKTRYAEQRADPEHIKVLQKQSADNIHLKKNDDIRLEQNDIEKLIEDLNKSKQATQRSLQFSLDDSSGKVVVKVINKNTHEIIKQFPSDEVLFLSKKLQEYMESENKPGSGSGLLIAEEV